MEQAVANKVLSPRATSLDEKKHGSCQICWIGGVFIGWIFLCYLNFTENDKYITF